ncbi:MAG TPA: Gfo/Idh/MocA family oxidoreductase [Rhodothermales bacterium]|nr:Gfo/Idh/MocA family oxidoreductase [Rhodothermales bacterium]
MTRLAIIGLGAVTRNIHLPAYESIRGEVEVVGGCDVSASAREAVKGRVQAVFEDAEAMIKSTQPDFVAICTPPALHREQCLMALDYGCHVLCEKPLAPSMDEAVEIARAAERAGRQVVVNTQFPYMSTYQAAKAQIGTAAFGRLLFMHAWQTFRRTADTETGWRGEMERRLCFEFGVHVFELARFFFDDDPETVTAHMPRPVAGERADVVNTIALGFEDGRGAAIVLDRLSQGPHRYLELSLDGEHGSIHTSIGGEVRMEVGLHTASRRPFFGLHVVKGGKAVLQHGDRSRLLAKEGMNPFAAATARHLRQFIAAVRDGREPRGAAQDNLKTLALAFAAYDSAESGRMVRMKEYVGEREESTSL